MLGCPACIEGWERCSLIQIVCSGRGPKLATIAEAIVAVAAVARRARQRTRMALGVRIFEVLHNTRLLEDFDDMLAWAARVDCSEDEQAPEVLALGLPGKGCR